MALFPFTFQMTEFTRLTSEITNFIESVQSHPAENVDHVREGLAGLRKELTMVVLRLEERVVEHVQKSRCTKTRRTPLHTGHHGFPSCRLQSSAPVSERPARTLSQSSDLSSSSQVSDMSRSSRSTASSGSGGPSAKKSGERSSNLSVLGQLRTAKLAQLDQTELGRSAREARPAHLVLGRRSSEDVQHDWVRQACDASRLSLLKDHSPWLVNGAPVVVAVDDEHSNSPRDSMGESPHGSPNDSPRSSIENFIVTATSMEHAINKSLAA